MSPNEFQLRAALHEGEGDSPDPDSLIAMAVGARRERRRRITAIAGGTTVVAVVAAGATALIGLGHHGGNGDESPRAMGGADRAVSTAPNSASPGVGPARSSSAPDQPQDAPKPATAYAASIACPATPDHLLLPGGGGSGQFGSTAPLFAHPVVAFRACGYPAGTSAGPRASIIAASQAQRIADQLEAGATRRRAVRCPANIDSAGGTVEIYPISAAGKQFIRLRPVVITFGCESEATNGTAVRYLINLPDPVGSMLTSPSGATSPGRVHGSPVR
jgi:hypothetical protein